VAAVLATAGVLAGGSPGGAATVTVTTVDELANAMLQADVDQVVLGADITLDCNVGGFSRPRGMPPLVLDGAGFTLSDTCDQGRTPIFLSSPVEIRALAIVTPTVEGPFMDALQGDLHLDGVDLTVRGTSTAIQLGGGSTVTDTDVHLEGLGTTALSTYGAAGPLVVEHTTITGDGSAIEGIAGEDVDGLVVRDTAIAVTGVGISAHVPLTVERSSIRGGFGAVRSRSDVLISDSTLVVDEALVPDGDLQLLGPALWMLEGAAVLQHSTALTVVTAPDEVRPTLQHDRGVGATIEVHASVLSAPGHRVCQAVDRPTSTGYNVTSDATCSAIDDPTDRVVADAGLAPFDPNAGRADPQGDGPLVDAVPAAVCRTPLDQLSQPRPSGAACDIGAIELQVPDPPTTSTTTTTTMPGGGTAPPATPVVGPARFTG
jgi:hypothetical protein